MPLGMCAHLALRRRKWPLFDLYVPLLLGLFLSCSVEIAQLWVRPRNTSALDVLTNVIGTVIGIGLGVIFENTAQSIEARLSFHPSDRSALMLVFFWAAWLVYPFFPLTGRTVPRHKIDLFLSAPPLVVLPFLSAAAAWFVFGRMLEASGLRSPKIWLGLSILLIPAQFVLVDRQPVPSDLLGAVAGILLFALRDSRTRRATGSEAWAFLAILVVRGLTPFHLSANAAAFNWMPFRTFLTAEWLHGIFVLIEKTFYYGAAIWMLRAAGTRLLRASVVVVAILAAIEIVQTRMPGRTPDVTDPLLAILIAFGIAILSRRRVAAALSPERTPVGNLS